MYGKAAFNFDQKATINDPSAYVYPPACADLSTFDPEAPADSDCDGIADTVDLTCPNTAAGLEVNADGCSTNDLADNDNDGILNLLMSV